MGCSSSFRLESSVYRNCTPPSALCLAALYLVTLSFRHPLSVCTHSLCYGGRRQESRWTGLVHAQILHIDSLLHKNDLQIKKPTLNICCMIISFHHSQMNTAQIEYKYFTTVKIGGFLYALRKETTRTQ